MQKRAYEEDVALAANQYASSSTSPSSSAPRTAKKSRYALPPERSEEPPSPPRQLARSPVSLTSLTPSSSAPPFKFAVGTHPPPPLPPRLPSLKGQRPPVPFLLPLPRRRPKPAVPAATELDAFLTNVAGADLSAHRALFVAQGFDMLMLRAVAGWRPADRVRALRELLQAGAEVLEGTGLGGLTPLQVLGLDIAIAGLRGGGYGA
ncbi:hypothetical protein B0H15DRAFT_244314 [Mycena belliarum]|uniref:Uncharacterized protein n=1 Tax=Mycena belliarum TaxID=1033014 RepID=A0AAD6U7B7_9AGAR|nr:hypothetical protein B0H15DRAFT_244314 [Mycena belliae]